MNKIRIKGLRRLDKILKRLVEKAEKKVIRKALRSGAKIVLAQAQRNVTKSRLSANWTYQHPPGTLKRSLAIKAMTRPPKGVLGVKVETREGNFQGAAFYAPMVEFGHKHGHRSKGSSRPQIEGKHYIKKAADSVSDRVGEHIISLLKVGIGHEAKRA